MNSTWGQGEHSDSFDLDQEMNGDDFGRPASFANLLLDSIGCECPALSDFLISLHFAVNKTWELDGITRAYLIWKKKKKVNIPQKDRALSVGIKKKVKLEP